MILGQLPASSRIWIFQSDRLLVDEEESALLEELKKFVSGWQAHGVGLTADAEILHSSIVVIGVDESKEPPSGCSIDKAFGLLKLFSEPSRIDFFNRLILNISYCNSAKILNLEQIQASLNHGDLSADSLVFNSLANNLGELRDNTYLTISTSWMAPKLRFA
ncbi:MAG: hypothetical protein ACK448_09190 [Bacteroidota bacterium]|jgi:hypothetical protein